MLASILLISLASVAFGAVYTTLASLRLKNWARRCWGMRFVDRWYRLFFSFAAAVTYLPVVVLPHILPDRSLYTIPSPWVWLTRGLQLAAVIVFLVALFQTDVFSFAGLRQLLRGGEPVPADRHERLVISGPYRWVRHLLYSTIIVALWLWPAMTVNRLVFVAVSAAYFYLGSIPEEQKMVQEFGAAYHRYQRTVPRLVPRPGRAYRSEE